DGKKQLAHDVHRLAPLGVRLVNSNEACVVAYIGSESTYVFDVKSNQGLHPVLVYLNEVVLKKPIQALSKRGADRKLWKLGNKEVAFVKVMWMNQMVEGATWETEADMMSRYPYPIPSILTVA
ncbi:hypothetical protein MTR67_012279, partial [Solanum verrucosum]